MRRLGCGRARTTMTKILITGATGLIGGLLTHQLRKRFVVAGVDRRRSGEENVRRLDLARSRRIDSLFQDVDAVVDLAALPGPQRSWREVAENNIPATMNALEAASRAGVRRFVFASSNHVTGMYEREPPYDSIVAGDYKGLDRSRIPLITTAWPIRPDSPYALGKALGEAAARYYADTFALSTICLRIGTVNPENRPLKSRHFSTLLTHADLARLVEAAITAPPERRYGVYYGVSANTWRIWDIENARDEIGYEALDDAERFRQRQA
jgi:nucleoside-diphosphate-sugar epimerase